MGQKVNPRLLRLGPVYNWSSRWFDDKKYKETLLEDRKIRLALMDKLKIAGISEVQIERSINSLRLTIYVSRPGIVIGRGGSGLEDLKKFIYEVLNIKKNTGSMLKIDTRIEAIKEPNLDAHLVASNIADQLVKRLPHRRVMAQAVGKIMGAGAKGVRIVISGRVGGAEIGRREKLQQGTVPLSTIRERIHFASIPALTKKGYIGIKVWINRGDK